MFRRPAIAADHRAIWAGGDHVNARQREFHQKYFEPLMTVRTSILEFVADIHCRLERVTQIVDPSRKSSANSFGIITSQM
jgi:hypothetical protein